MLLRAIARRNEETDRDRERKKEREREKEGGKREWGFIHYSTAERESKGDRQGERDSRERVR